VTTTDGVRLYVRRLGDGPGAVIVPNGIYLIPDSNGLRAAERSFSTTCATVGCRTPSRTNRELGKGSVTMSMISIPSGAMRAFVDRRSGQGVRIDRSVSQGRVAWVGRGGM